MGGEQENECGGEHLEGFFNDLDQYYRRFQLSEPERTICAEFKDDRHQWYRLRTKQIPRFSWSRPQGRILYLECRRQRQSDWRTFNGRSNLYLLSKLVYGIVFQFRKKLDKP